MSVRRPRTPEYRAWAAMKTFCFNKKDPHYKDYGGRGIEICDEWLKFDNFINDLGPRPSAKYVLGRLDVNKGYYPKNCQWTIQKVQQNRRRNNVMIIFRGKNQTMKQWADELGIPYARLFARLMQLGWSSTRALTEK